MARLADSVDLELWAKLEQLLRNGHLAHALAFSGGGHDGENLARKKQLAWALIQNLLCERGEGCGECGPCLRVAKQQSEGVLELTPEKGTIKLEGAHQVNSFLSLRKVTRARVILVEEASALNPQATNALLKILEEPPEDTYFLLLTADVAQLTPTLRSRLQVLRFPMNFYRSEEPEWQELRAQVVAFLLAAARGERTGMDDLVTEAKDRDTGLKVLQILQQVLRDLTVADQGRALEPELFAKAQELLTWTKEKRLALWQKAFQMELDFQAHVDRSLLFENFFYQARA